MAKKPQENKEEKKKNDLAAEQKPKNKGGRPRKEIDKAVFEKLCAIQCTQAEICSVFSCQDDTLQSWCRRTYGRGFSEVFNEKRLDGRASLRRNQWKMAAKNPTMAIWLGKQYLGQKDKWDEDDNREILEKLDSVLDKMGGVI